MLIFIEKIQKKGYKISKKPKKNSSKPENWPKMVKNGQKITFFLGLIRKMINYKILKRIAYPS